MGRRIMRGGKVPRCEWVFRNYGREWGVYRGRGLLHGCNRSGNDYLAKRVRGGVIKGDMEVQIS